MVLIFFVDCFSFGDGDYLMVFIERSDFKSAFKIENFFCFAYALRSFLELFFENFVDFIKIPSFLFS